MPKNNNSATFVANSVNGTIEITQLENNTTTQVDALVLLQLLGHNDRNIHVEHCHKCNMPIKYNTKNFHLYIYPNIVNTYLTKGFDRELKEYILENFKSIDKTSNISSTSKAILHVNDTTNTHTPPMPSKGTVVDFNFERYLSSLTSDSLLFLYNKQIILEAKMSGKELPWEM